jgi:hypothetical protein
MSLKFVVMVIACAIVSGCLCGQIPGSTEPTSTTVAVATAVSPTSSTSTLALEEPTTSTAPPTTTIQDIVSTTTTLANVTGLSEACSKKFGDARLKCYAGLAVASGDKSVCDKLGVYADKQVCIAVVEKDPSVCLLIISSVDRKDICYTDLALALRNVTLCRRVQSVKMSNDCLRQLGRME